VSVQQGQAADGTGPGGPGPSGAGPGGPGPGGAGSAGLPGYGTLSAGSKPPWKSADGNKTVFRHSAPFVLWWVWIAFTVFNVIDLSLGSRHYSSLVIVVMLLVVTGVMYACALRPRVVADDDGVVIYNPLQEHRVPWGAVSGVFLGESVEFTCARPGQKKDKTIHSWALYSGRRSRMRSQLQRSVWLPKSMSERAPAEAKQLAATPPAQLMAAELGRRATTARDGGAPGDVLTSRWAWQPIAAIAVPAAVLLALVLAR
jgi:hypothetical protein